MWEQEVKKQQVDVDCCVVNMRDLTMEEGTRQKDLRQSYSEILRPNRYELIDFDLHRAHNLDIPRCHVIPRLFPMSTFDDNGTSLCLLVDCGDFPEFFCATVCHFLWPNLTEKAGWACRVWRCAGAAMPPTER